MAHAMDFREMVVEQKRLREQKGSKGEDRKWTKDVDGTVWPKFSRFTSPNCFTQITSFDIDIDIEIFDTLSWRALLLRGGGWGLIKEKSWGEGVNHRKELI